MKFSTIVCCSLFCLVGCSQSDQTTSTAPVKPLIVTKPTLEVPAYITNEAAAKKEYDRRFPVREEFFNAAKELVSKSKSQAVADVYNFAVEHGILALPGPGMWQDVQAPKKEPFFSIVVLFPEDTKLGEPWDKFIADKSAAAVYNTNRRVMVLQKDLAPSKETKGLILLHESFHARDGIESKLSPDDAAMFCLGEIRAHEFEDKLLGVIHPNYKIVVGEIADLLKKMLSDPSVNFKQVNDFVERSIDRAYERQVISKYERAGMWHQLFYCGNFRLYDRMLASENDRINQKIGFLKDFLERGGTAQWKH